VIEMSQKEMENIIRLKVNRELNKIIDGLFAIHTAYYLIKFHLYLAVPYLKTQYNIIRKGITQARSKHCHFCGDERKNTEGNLCPSCKRNYNLYLYLIKWDGF